MEVEVKLRLPDAAAHGRVLSLFGPFRRETLRQENFFFDGSENELSSKRAVLRVRFYNGQARCVVSLKAKAILIDGISRVEEEEEEMDPMLGRECVAEPEKLGSVKNRILKKCEDEFGVKGFVGLGVFANVRDVIDWKGLKLEVDETNYDFGTSYEIECESSDPEGAKKLLEEYLKENEIEYKYSEASKFAVFRSGKLP
ncbi:triphosphate tunnel metalloenzyme 3-like isoform X2 [Punica granatum]|uniref:CYTH domain-containing protein n=2 Tax=Punica granatum TaxID=22663 RepID=A0A218W0G1_PUNGR|nr:triphosphate tunnel metalloenzyme 3-like isoform X1 [Punica granatum]XP_031385693.1 triphosphate tunnel metalloenzyme 3-like isoform X2 [Punica granatum]OWM65958.1 hypothetical protein CDL15_Pgr015383 [Punica granatum]PKI66751.1 hypothetical protein CRG98_012946 [Punica granatum]